MLNQAEKWNQITEDLLFSLMNKEDPFALPYEQDDIAEVAALCFTKDFITGHPPMRSEANTLHFSNLRDARVTKGGMDFYEHLSGKITDRLTLENRKAGNMAVVRSWIAIIISFCSVLAIILMKVFWP